MLYVSCNLAQDVDEEEPRDECQPGPDGQSLESSKDAHGIGCDDDKSNCERLQTATGEATFSDGALEYDTKL